MFSGHGTEYCACIDSEAAANFATSGLDVTVESSTAPPVLKILPVPVTEATSSETVGSGYAYKLVYEVDVHKLISRTCRATIMPW